MIARQPCLNFARTGRTAAAGELRRQASRKSRNQPKDTLMTQSLTGKAALVTGAAKGIGASTAEAMAAASALRRRQLCQ